jgi:hypothetical protein
MMDSGDVVCVVKSKMIVGMHSRSVGLQLVMHKGGKSIGVGRLDIALLPLPGVRWG